MSTAALKALASTVAVATPATSMPSTSTKNRLSAIFSMPDIASTMSGARVLPALMNMAASKL